MKRFIQALLTVLLTLGTSTALLAEPPAKSDCFVFDDVYERLECRQAALAGQLTYTSDTVFAEGKEMHGYVKPARLANIKNAKSKAKRAVEKNNTKVFKRLVKSESRGNKDQDFGHLVPLDPDDVDGICDYEAGETCAAIELDADGDLQECNPEKKNKGKGKSKAQGGGNGKFDGLVCDRWFDSEEDTNDSEIADMEDIAWNLDESFSATEDNLLEMNEHLTLINNNPPNKSAEVFLGGQDENGNCDIPETNIHLANSVIALRVIHAAAEGTSTLVHNGCQQTAVALGFGGNGSLVCVAFDAATLVANLAYIAVDEADKVQNGNVQAAIMACSAKTADVVAGLLADVAALKELMQQEHDDIVTNDDVNTTEIVNVLNTPHGLRDKFPKP